MATARTYLPIWLRGLPQEPHVVQLKCVLHVDKQSKANWRHRVERVQYGS